MTKKQILFRWFLIVSALYAFAFYICNVQADEYAGFMLGVSKTDAQDHSAIKLAQVGYRQYFGAFGLYQIEGGGWFQKQNTAGRSSSGYLATQIGMEVGEFVAMRIAAGPCVITTPDTALGGMFPMFTEDVFLGVKGPDGTELGFKYKHFSSAGLVLPNQGKDFGGIEASFRF